MISWLKSLLVSVIAKAIQILPRYDRPRIVEINLFQGSFSQVSSTVPDFDLQAQLTGL
jgi:hypothetical protein